MFLQYPVLHPVTLHACQIYFTTIFQTCIQWRLVVCSSGKVNKIHVSLLDIVAVLIWKRYAESRERYVMQSKQRQASEPAKRKVNVTLFFISKIDSQHGAKGNYQMSKTGENVFGLCVKGVEIYTKQKYIPAKRYPNILRFHSDISTANSIRPGLQVLKPSSARNWKRQWRHQAYIGYKTKGSFWHIHMEVKILVS